MRGEAHLVLTGLLVGGLVAVATGDHQAATLAGVVSGAGALLPDLDHPGSLGAGVLHARPVATIVKATVGHRGPTHSLLFCVAVFLGALVLGLAMQPPTLAGIQGAVTLAGLLALGSLLHLAEDVLSGSGVPLLWPLRRRRYRWMRR